MISPGMRQWLSVISLAGLLAAVAIVSTNAYRHFMATNDGMAVNPIVLQASPEIPVSAIPMVITDAAKDVQ